MPAGSNGVAVFDFDKDGWMDVAFTHPSAPGLTLWRNVDGNRSSRSRCQSSIGRKRGAWLRLITITTAGSISPPSAKTHQAESIALLRNEGPAGFRDVTKDVGLDKTALSHPRAVVPFDYDGDGGADLLITQANAAPVLLRNIGGSKNHWLRVTLTGTNDNKTCDRHQSGSVRRRDAAEIRSRRCDGLSRPGPRGDSRRTGN